jgi:Methyltransferase FkbM domain
VVPMTSIDEEVEHRNLKSPFLIKLDTHGFEIPILVGAETTLVETEVLVIECYNFIIGKEAVRFWAMCEWLTARDFSPIDMFDVSYRPSDHALWQMDIVFMRSSRPEFRNAAYR